MPLDAASLTSKVMTSLLAKLEWWGNGVSEEHNCALQRIAYSFAQDVFRGDNEPERLAIGLDTGLGKTALLITFLNTLRQEQILYPVLVCVPNYKAMKQFRDGLLEVHSPDEVGCRFTPGEKSRDAGLTIEPVKDEQLNSCRVVIACHARADSSRGEWEKLVQFNDGKRAVYYDEALKRGSVTASPIREIKADFNLIEDFLDAPLRDELKRLIDKLKAAAEDEIIPLHFDPFDERKVNKAIREHRRTGSRDRQFKATLDLVSCKYNQVRHGNGDYFTFQNTLPEMQSLFVLDANHPHSVLSQLDETIEQIFIPRFKSFGSVTFKAYPHNIGKTVIEKNQDFYVQWAVDVVRQAQEEGKNPAVICFKDMETKVKEAIADQTPVIPWGMHAGSNEYADIDALICIGVLRLSDEVTKGHITLHRNDLAGSVEESQQIAAAEAALNLYQAVSRGQSRQVHIIDGKTVAKPSTIYLSGPLEQKQLALLHQAMPGCTYELQQYDAVINDIKNYLAEFSPAQDDGLPPDLFARKHVSITQLVRGVASFKELKKTGRTAVLNRLIQNGWEKIGRSLAAPLA